jgi:acyl dehydratase
VSSARRRARLNAAAEGKTYPETTHEVTAGAIEAYARATNDLNERYLAGENSVASPVWPVVPAFGFFMAAARDPDLGAEVRRLMHLREHHLLRAPVRPGDVLRVTGVLSSVDPDAGTFTVDVTERNQEGIDVAEVRATMLVRGAGVPLPTTAEEPPETASFESRVAIEPDQTQRYARASGDHNPIHLDRRAARLAGLRDVIVHGMCTMAMATAGVVDGLAGGDPTLVERVDVSFVRPVTLGQELTTRYWVAAEDADGQTFRFASFTSEGAAVLAPAEARVRAPSPSV